jgi:EAL domain-containing protein (putative c-di-GMP-specific phosphodiesterase class I)
VELLTQTMRTTADRRLALETALRAALNERRLRVVYQPIVRLGDRTVMGFEALARWDDPVYGPVGPGEFVPLAEETGLIVPLGSWVLRTACAQVAQWRVNDPGHPDLMVAVNVSARQLIHPDLVAMVRRALTDSGTPPRQLSLEITESTLMEAAGPAMAAVEELKRELGVSIAIDDFGTGYSSLAYLTRLPADTLKVDRGFVDGLAGADPNDTVVVATVIRLADALGLRVTAEGVETPQQAADLRGMRCQYGQGYLFAAPLSAEQVPDWLATAPSG